MRHFSAPIAAVILLASAGRTAEAAYPAGLLSLLLAAPAVAERWTPAEGVILAAADLAALPPDVQKTTRYFWLNAWPAADRDSLVAVLQGHVNGLSTEVDIARLMLVANGMLLRLNLVYLGGDWTENWEKLFDPLFVVKVEVQEVKTQRVVKYWPGGVWPGDGKYYAANSFTYYVDEPVAAGAKKIEQALAPWLSETAASKKALATLVAGTGSKIPIVGGIWFLNQTAIQQGRNPGYYDFLGVKSQKDFERIVRFDGGLARKLEHRRVAAWSGITLQPRRIERLPTVVGALWRTFDNEKAVAKANPLRILDDPLEFKATEQFAPLLNGLPAWLLANNKGELQTKAPDDIVGGDRLGGGNDTRLHINLSCIRCHLGMHEREMGIKEIEAVHPKRLDSVDQKKLLELQRLYHRPEDLTDEIRIDRERYARAIKRATDGWTLQQYATEYQRWFGYYEEARVDLVWFAKDFGLDVKRVRSAFVLAEMNKKLDPVLSLMIDGKAPIRQYEEVIPVAWQTWMQWRGLARE